MRVHIPALPHTDIDPTWTTCAFSQKIRHLARMLVEQGHHVTVYGTDTWDHDGQHVTTITRHDQARWFGDETWRNRVMDRWDPTDPCWTESNTAAITAIRERIQPRDLLAFPIGNVQADIAAAFPANLAFESGVGYEGVWLPHRVYESYAWLHHIAGARHETEHRWYDTVIPNAFDPDNFTIAPKQDYVLYLGRMTPRKGLPVIQAIADTGIRVITAGQGDHRIEGAEHVGVVRGKERADLLAGARALLAPTTYCEPFGGVTIEAMLSGTQPITTDFGAFTETIQPEFRCRTLAEFLDAIDRAGDQGPHELRHHATATYSLDAVAPRYDAYLTRLDGLWGQGWPALT